MADSEFTIALQQAVERRQDYFDKKFLPALKEKFRLFLSSFHSIYDILLRKSLIREDPYKHDVKISEITPPDSSSFLESEKIDQLSVRLSNFESQLDFLISFYQFSIDFLTLKRIKSLIDLVKYIDWMKLTETSTNVTTRALAEMISKGKQGTDTLSAGILTDSVKQISNLVRDILEKLKILADFQREYYKFNIRIRILDKANITQNDVKGGTGPAIKKLKMVFATSGTDLSFFPELIDEILNEDFSIDKEAIRIKLIDSLTVTEQKEEKKKDVSYKDILMDSVRIFSGVSIHLEKASEKLTESSILIAQRKLSFGERFRKWLESLLNGKQSKEIYEIDYFDDKTSTNKKTKVDFFTFREEMIKKARLLGSYSSKMSTNYMRLEAADEDRIFSFLSENIGDVQRVLVLLPGLDLYFKSEMPRELRSRVKGIKLEINAIKNVLIKANQKRYEYVSRKEEAEQLKKLGISGDM